MPFELTENVRVDRDEHGNVQHLEHFQEPFVAAPSEDYAAAAVAGIPFMGAATPQALAEAYLKQVASIYGISETMLPGPDAAAAPSGNGSRSKAVPRGSKLELAEEKELMGTTTISYQQTYDGLPVWEAGVSVTIQSEPMRVTASQSSTHEDISLPRAGELTATRAAETKSITPETLKQRLGINKSKLTVNGTRQLIYQYDPERRIDPAALIPRGEPMQEGPPTLPLPPVPDSIKTGQHYVVTEVLFTLPVEGYGPVNWRAFLEISTGAVLYLRAFVACVTGMVFTRDPATAGAGAAVTPKSAAATLNPFRSAVPLDGLTVATPQTLSGQFVRIAEVEAPTVASPTAPPSPNFFFDAPSREFAAVNAYRHCDWLFRHMQGMGFNIPAYFNGTAFPVRVDPCAFSDALNARAPGNVAGTGSDGFRFGLAGTPFPAVSIAADLRVVLHEFGHALLWDSVHSPNFGFAHSAGDSLAAILLDPESALRTDAVRRFDTFPWELPGRRHDRDVASGWAWDGSKYGPFTATDGAGYLAEQILSTTLFRVYRSLGGDSSDVNRRKLAARQTAYLIFRAIGSLATSPVTVTPRPEIFATALMNADIGTGNFEGYRGGTFHKVIRWSFEKQGLYQPAGAPKPVKTPGAPPPVDVYINDGRNGEYTYQPVHWECHDIWNRLAASAGGGGGVHQTPIVGQVNYAYVRVKNRGTQPAANVFVRGFSANPGVGLTWPGDWKPMDTPELTVAGGIPAGGSVVVGPFKWKPKVVGHECMFMDVRATGDPSNISPGTFYPCAAGPTPEWRLVPYDNNIGQRNVVPVAGAGGASGLLTSFAERRFTVRNPLDASARIEVRAEMPSLLASRGWSVLLDQREGGTSFGLPAGVTRDVSISLRPGKTFEREVVLAAKAGAAIRIQVFADGILLGGMTYQLDTNLRQAPVERMGARPVRPNDPAIVAMLREATAREEGTDLMAEEMEMPIAAEVPEDEETTAVRLLTQLGVTEETIGKVSRVKVKKVMLEIEVGEDQ